MEEGSGGKYLVTDVSAQNLERKERHLTGSAVDSNSPQSRTRPVMRPTESSASR
jgi:hypothetical protein